jgi:hypothetical protein
MIFGKREYLAPHLAERHKAQVHTRQVSIHSSKEKRFFVVLNDKNLIYKDKLFLEIPEIS